MRDLRLHSGDSSEDMYTPLKYLEISPSVLACSEGGVQPCIVTQGGTMLPLPAPPPTGSSPLSCRTSDTPLPLSKGKGFIPSDWFLSKTVHKKKVFQTNDCHQVEGLVRGLITVPRSPEDRTRPASVWKECSPASLACGKAFYLSSFPSLSPAASVLWQDCSGRSLQTRHINTHTLTI